MQFKVTLSYLSEEWSGNVDISVFRLTSHHPSTLWHGQSHAKRIVACIHSCRAQWSQSTRETFFFSLLLKSQSFAASLASIDVSHLTNLNGFSSIYEFDEVRHQLSLLTGDHHAGPAVFHRPLQWKNTRIPLRACLTKLHLHVNLIERWSRPPVVLRRPPVVINKTAINVFDLYKERNFKVNIWTDHILNFSPRFHTRNLEVKTSNRQLTFPAHEKRV